MVGVKAHAVVADLDSSVRGGGPGADLELGGPGVFEGVGPHLGQHGLYLTGCGQGQRQVFGQICGHIPVQRNGAVVNLRLCARAPVGQLVPQGGGGAVGWVGRWKCTQGAHFFAQAGQQVQHFVWPLRTIYTPLVSRLPTRSCRSCTKPFCCCCSFCITSICRRSVCCFSSCRACAASRRCKSTSCRSASFRIWM